MRFLDIDLDFFLNKNSYYSGSDALRLGEDYKAWPEHRVRKFLEKRCGLSGNALVPGRIIESHDLVVAFWRALIESGNLTVPFDVIHIDAHPDFSVRGGLYLVSDKFYFDPGSSLMTLEEEYIHSGNYLTFAIARGWVASLTWIPLQKPSVNPGKAHGDSRRSESRINERNGIPFKVISWHNFKTGKAFDYMILSQSPAFTPPTSDSLVPLVAGYMKPI
jgi:hypothetical protein